ncbi:hypothetical protein [Gordonia sp. CPCC 205333]|uniref:hypothetical protein n=1 Tax=Gordonia sp. CPCC 205333 TaxID=3140790 RepID=UPI003AF3E670
MTQPPNPGENPQGQPGGYQPPQQGGYQPPQQPGQPQPGGYQPPQQPGGYQPPQQPGGYQPPQQPGGYQPGQPGGYQPPQAGGPDFAKQGQGYQQPGYQAQPGGYHPAGQPGYPANGPVEFNVGDAFSWAWNKFSKNAVPLIVATLAYAVIIGVIYAIVWVAAAALGTTSTTSYTSSYSGETMTIEGAKTLGAASFIVLIVGYLIVLVLVGVFASAFINSVLKIADGQQVDIGSFFKPRNVVQVIVASLLVGIAAAIGSIIIIGGIIVALFAFYTTWAVVERDLSAIDGIKTSFNLVKDNFVTTLITYLLAAIIATVGLILCGIGGLVSIPVAALFTAYSWRRVSRGPIAPLTP